MTRHELEKQLAEKKAAHKKYHPSLPKAKDIEEQIQALEAQLRDYVDDAPADPGGGKAKQIISNLKKFFPYLIRRAGIAVLYFGIIIFYIWVGDPFDLDTIFGSFTMRVSNVVMSSENTKMLFPKKKTLNTAITIVAISEKTEDKLGHFDSSWRKYHAVLVDKLSQAGAKVIVFDMTFTDPADSEIDRAFIDAIKRTKEHNRTAVIVGIGDIDNTSELSEFAEELRQVVSVNGYGVTCVGKKQYIETFPLVISKDPNGKVVLPSLALKTYEAYYELQPSGYDINWDDLEISWGPYKVGFSEREISSKDSEGCPIVKKDDIVANMLIDFSPLSVLRNSDRRYPYETVIAENTDPAILKKQFEGKIVMVGSDWYKDSHSVSRAEQRHGMEIHVDALNTLLNEIVIRKFDTRSQFLIAFLLGLTAVAFKYLEKWYRHIIFCIVILCLYFIIMLLVYINYYRILSPHYHIATFLIMWWFFGKLQRKKKEG